MSEPAALLLLVVLPLLGAGLVAALSGADSGESGSPRAAAMATMLTALVLALAVFAGYDAANPRPADFDLPWMPSLGVHLHFGVDGFNLYLVLLTAVLFPVVLGVSWTGAHSARPLYLALLLATESSLLGTFLSQNLLLLFVFWEAVLIPAGVLILVYGGERRRDAALAFFLYTLAGSVLLLAAVIALGVECLRQTGAWSFELDAIRRLDLDWDTQLFVFVAVMLACAVKSPLIPLHSWLPLSYREAPPAVTALMAGVMSKMGAFGILKLALPLAPAVAVAAAPGMVALAVASVLYGAVLALRQQDYKTLVAYSSLSHMGYIVLGAFSFQPAAIHGALLQMLSHGMAIAGLFLLLGAIEERCGPAYRQAGSLATSAPRLAVVMMLFVLTTMALPLTSGFTSEFLILLGAVTHGIAAWRADAGSLPLIAALAALSGMILGAGYMLRFARALLFGSRGGPAASIVDLRRHEVLPLAVPLAVILWIGVAPSSFIGKAQNAASELAQLERTAERPAPDGRPVIADTAADTGSAHGR